MERHIIHLHVPAFPIAVERASQARLRGRPVAAANGSGSRASVLCASAEAKDEGVGKGMPLVRAKQTCPGLVVIHPDPVRIEKASRLLAEVTARYTPIWEPLRPGHIYMDVTGTSRLWGRAKDTAERARLEVLERLSLSGTAGVAVNKLVSGIASRVYLGGGVLDVDPGCEEAFLAPLRVDYLPGLGPARSLALLRELGVGVVGELASLDPVALKPLFGRRALVIHRLARGIDPTPVYPPCKTPVLREEQSFPEGENDDHRLLRALYRLVEACCRGLRERGEAPLSGRLLLRYADGREVSRRVSFSGETAWEADLFPPLCRAFHSACTRRVRVGLIRVEFGRLTPACGRQLSLFSREPSPGEAGAVLTRALDRIRTRHGGGAIGYGVT
ncbi:MAG: hypothetical protein ACLFUE_04030 [Desulfobacteraceae bacterium]